MTAGADLKCELRLGAWQDALADVVEVDALVTDPPYGARTHNGQRHGRRDGHADDWASSRGIQYAHWTEAEVRAFVESWSPRVRGWFVAFTDSELYPVGSKPLWLMRAIVRDYTRRGDLVVDPCAGGATTLLAARAEGRHAVGAELDAATYEIARKRIARPFNLGLFDAVGGDDVEALSDGGDVADCGGDP